MLFIKTVRVPIYDALYTCNDFQEYFPILGKPAESIEELDRFSNEIMEEEGKQPPFHRISAHIIGYEKKKVKR